MKKLFFIVFLLLTVSLFAQEKMFFKKGGEVVITDNYSKFSLDKKLSLKDCKKIYDGKGEWVVLDTVNGRSTIGGKYFDQMITPRFVRKGLFNGKKFKYDKKAIPVIEESNMAIPTSVGVYLIFILVFFLSYRRTLDIEDARGLLFWAGSILVTIYLEILFTSPGGGIAVFGIILQVMVGCLVAIFLLSIFKFSSKSSTRALYCFYPLPGYMVWMGFFSGSAIVTGYFLILTVTLFLLLSLGEWIINYVK